MVAFEFAVDKDRQGPVEERRAAFFLVARCSPVTGACGVWSRSILLLTGRYGAAFDSARRCAVEAQVL